MASFSRTNFLSALAGGVNAVGDVLIQRNQRNRAAQQQQQTEAQAAKEGAQILNLTEDLQGKISKRKIREREDSVSSFKDALGVLREPGLSSETKLNALKRIAPNIREIAPDVEDLFRIIENSPSEVSADLLSELGATLKVPGVVDKKGKLNLDTFQPLARDIRESAIQRGLSAEETQKIVSTSVASQFPKTEPEAPRTAASPLGKLAEDRQALIDTGRFPPDDPVIQAFDRKISAQGLPEVKERKLTSLEQDMAAIRQARDSNDTQLATVLERGLEKKLSNKISRTIIDPETGLITIEEGDLAAAGLTLTEQKNFRRQIFDVKGSLRIMDQIEGLLSNTRVGIKGITKSFAQDILQQVSPTRIKQDAGVLFDEDLPALDLLGNTLAYSLARAEEPNAVLTKGDVENKLNGLKIKGVLTSPLKIKSSFFQLRVKLIEDHNAAIGALTKGIPLVELPAPKREKDQNGNASPDTGVDVSGLSTEELLNLVR